MRMRRVDGRWRSARPVPRVGHRRPAAAASGEVVGARASRMRSTPRRTPRAAVDTRPDPAASVVQHGRHADLVASPRGWRHATSRKSKE